MSVVGLDIAALYHREHEMHTLCITSCRGSLLRSCAAAQDATNTQQATRFHGCGRDNYASRFRNNQPAAVKVMMTITAIGHVLASTVSNGMSLRKFAFHLARQSEGM